MKGIQPWPVAQGLPAPGTHLPTVDTSMRRILPSGLLGVCEGKSLPTVCWLTGFGDSSLDFVLRIWIRDPQQGLTNIRGKVLLALWDSFKENDVGIPYPHREVIMKTPLKTVSEPAPRGRK